MATICVAMPGQGVSTVNEPAASVAAEESPSPGPFLPLPDSTHEPGFRLLLPAGATGPHAEHRLFGILPNYRATDAQQEYRPLTTSEKFKIAQRDTFDWPNYFLIAGYAMQSQLAISGFGGKSFFKGFAGYYGRTFGDQIIGSYITEAIMPTLLHEDPRFFRSGIGSPWQRAIRAARQVVITRTNSGASRFNFSEVLGNSATIAITTSYYADSRSAPEAAERLGLALGNDAISNLLTEFWPDVKRSLFRKHSKERPLASAPASMGR